MLSNLIVRVEELLRQEFDSDNDQKQSDDLKATQGAIDTLLKPAKQLWEEYRALAENLPDEERESMQRGMEDLRNLTEKMQQNFNSGQYRQRRSIDDLINKVERLRSILYTRWTDETRKSLQPHSEMLAVLKMMPELSNQVLPLQRIETELRRHIDQPPSHREVVQKFAEGIESLDEGLKEIQGLTPQVQEFLVKVRSNVATLADVDEEVLVWCRQYGKHFRISLGA